MNCNVGHLDIVNDLGMSVDRAYSELLKDKKEKVIVGIIDQVLI
jgi:hypothetical protein